MEQKTIKGSDIVRVHMIGSMYNNNAFDVFMKDGSNFRIKGEEILPLLQQQTFTAEKARVHEYLKIKNA